ncbi:MAG TPA: phytoene/squalene synthase family protein [Gammaproteobacteria bacterium]|nr:phytoene/squalene synthase family protein [Gammaproteobacteria bacterium]
MTPNDDKLNQILKQVSRSFYLSIRILPTAMRDPVGIAYLLARAADSVADNTQLAHQASAQQHLQALLKLMSFQNPCCARELSETLLPSITNPAEKKLIRQLPAIINHFFLLEEKDKRHVQAVVTTLIQGMQMDLRIFNQRDHIVALQDQAALEQYIYLVAGCVGEFWTKVAIDHLPAVSHWDKKNQSKLGIEFGKALQLTNILRDIAKDARLGRCYLPDDGLSKHALNTRQLLDKNNHNLFQPLINEQIHLALQYFESAESYLISTPRTAIRLRLASLWPILIGLKTLSLIANKENFLDPEKNIKVHRKWVYRMLACSTCMIGSNTLVSRWIKQLKSAIP